MSVILGSDEKTSFTEFVYEWLTRNNYSIRLAGHLADPFQKWKWAELGIWTGQQIANQSAAWAVLCCSSGTGVCLAANRIKGARAALCWTPQIAFMARKWNNANILCFSLLETTQTVAEKILAIWRGTEFDEEGLNQVNQL